MVPSADPAKCDACRLVDEDPWPPFQDASVYRKSRAPCAGVLESNSRVQTATALGKLGHPDGELNLTRAAAKHGVIQMVYWTLDLSSMRLMLL